MERTILIPRGDHFYDEYVIWEEANVVWNKKLESTLSIVEMNICTKEMLW